MRAYVLFSFLAIAVALGSCGGGSSSHRLEQSFPVGQCPSGTNAAGVMVSINHYKQSDHYLIVNLTITNGSKAPIQFHTGQGQTMDGFRAALEGQSFMAVRRGAGFNPWTGYTPPSNAPAGELELPVGISTSLEVRFDFKVDRKDFDWVITVLNTTQGGQPLPDISIAFPGTNTSK
jgi:hypothetical protein